MTNLIERLEAAREPSRELDAEIAVASNWGCLSDAYKELSDDPSITKQGYVRHLFNGGLSLQEVPKFTADVGRAAMLVPTGMAWTVGYGQSSPDEPMGAAVIGRNARFIGHDANYDAIAHSSAATPALALAAAALRAQEVDQSA